MNKFSEEEKVVLEAKLKDIMYDLIEIIDSNKEQNSQHVIAAKSAFENILFLKLALKEDKSSWYTKCSNVIDSGELNHSAFLPQSIRDKIAMLNR